MSHAMTYTPKPGDRVTSPLLVGEWEVMFVLGQLCMVVTSGVPSSRAAVPLDSITPVAPSLHPEPAVGSVVRAHGELWIRMNTEIDTDEHQWRSGHEWSEWSHLAAASDLSPVVAVDDVADWLDGLDARSMAAQYRAKFGGWDK